MKKEMSMEKVWLKGKMEYVVVKEEEEEGCSGRAGEKPAKRKLGREEGDTLTRREGLAQLLEIRGR